MNKYLLETFVTVVETRRITAAARLLNLTQPAVSQQIRHLEAYFGIPLLTREQQGVRPTLAGELVFSRARRILAEFDGLEQDIDELTRAHEREVVIGATPTAGNCALPCALWTFRDRFPKANLRLEIGSNLELGEKVLTHGVDVAVIEGPLPDHVAHAQGVKVRRVNTDPMVLVTPARSLWSAGVLTKEQLSKAPLILPGKGMGVQMAFEEALGAEQMMLKDLNVAAQMEGLEGMKATLEACGGVLVCMKMAVQKELRRGAYKEVTPPWLRTLITIHAVSVDETLPPVGRRFIRFIAQPEEISSCFE